jgi:hypothetical protein
MTIERPMFPPRAESEGSFFQQPAPDHPPARTPTGDSAKLVRGLSRRVALAGLALLPAAWPAAAAKSDPAFALIAEKLAADAAHCEAIDAYDEAELNEGIDPYAAEEADQRCCAACDVVNKLIGGWPRRHPRRLPASPRCSGSPMKSRTAAWSGPPPTRLVRKVGITSSERPWPWRSRRRSGPERRCSHEQAQEQLQDAHKARVDSQKQRSSPACGPPQDPAGTVTRGRLLQTRTRTSAIALAGV